MIKKKPKTNSGWIKILTKRILLFKLKVNSMRDRVVEQQQTGQEGVSRNSPNKSGFLLCDPGMKK